MAPFIDAFIKNVIFCSLLAGNSLLPIEAIENIQYIKHTDFRFDIQSDINILGIDFYDIKLSKFETEFYFVLHTNNPEVLVNSNHYFNTENNIWKDFNNMFESNNIQKRKYSDHVPGYSVITDIKYIQGRYRLSIRLTEK